MQHVDDGTIHAWLDGEISDRAEAARIEEHLRTCVACGARVAAERATIDQADALLASVAPAGERPSFRELVHGSAMDVPESAVGVPARNARLLVYGGWAASIALALGLGWSARAVFERETDRGEVTVLSQRTDATAPSGGFAGAPSPAEAETSDDRVEETTRTPVRQGQAPAAPPDSSSPPASPRDALRQLAEAAPQPASQDLQADSPPRSDLTPSAIASPVAATSPAAAAPAAPAAPPVAAEPPSFPEEARTAGSAQPEFVALSGESSSSSAAPVETAGWQAVARTEAAARTGMALYGVDNLEPAQTLLGPDGRIVRTTYRLESGALVELYQQRGPAAASPDTGTLEMPGSSFIGAGRGGIAANRLASSPRTWSTMRGDVRLTLQTTSDAADLEALGEKLRVD